MPIEPIRKCGYRKVGGIYVCGSGMAVPCDLLPLPITPCPTCHFTIPFTRGFLWIHRDYLSYRSEGHYYSKDGCKCSKFCPICYPHQNILQDEAMLMWVGSKFYSPESFVKEAMEMGVSKRIAEIPKGLILGATWVLLAHSKVPFDVGREGTKVYVNVAEGSQPVIKEGVVVSERNILKNSEPVYKPAIFYAFRPTKLEFLIWQSEATAKRLDELKTKGLTPVIVPDNMKEHA